eukprot:CAMPEP_0174747786 /NCGR_PEP_ID=MMETSP1094-20130205/92074_1 /TAXON_ID=156173 /ORGANISM="Chrysochromulina brevifilum, Strain UTEX LB 985" /LENGTH=32 /DNA_ID= /DNA_START= /DNA_END= /DNA_ORIENTATION=
MSPLPDIHAPLLNRGGEHRGEVSLGHPNLQPT